MFPLHFSSHYQSYFALISPGITRVMQIIHICAKKQSLLNITAIMCFIFKRILRVFFLTLKGFCLYNCWSELLPSSEQ